MGLARTLSVALEGLTAHVVTVEADIGTGLPALLWSGLPDTAVRQAGDRVRSAVVNSRESWPVHRITIGLSPASVRKTGSGLDLAIAVAVLAAAGSLPHDAVTNLVVIGELGLDGRVQPVTGVLPAVIGAIGAGRSRVVVPRANAREATVVPGAEVTAVGSLAELCAVLRGEWVDISDVDEPAAVDGPVAGPDLSDVVGQPAARYVLEVAAAGGHHVYLSGPPGVGKTMLAERLPGLLPDLSEAEALEVSSIHSLLGKLPAGRELVTRAPFCAPHHSATVASLIGGGGGIPRPGAISLAHRGVLFLDEAPEFERRTLDALRQPLESGTVTISRVSGVATYPSRFLLVVAANRCPCARGGSDDAAACECNSTQLRNYRSRLSGPLRDRLDLRAELSPISRSILTAGAAGEPTAVVRARVEAARDRALHRLRETPWSTNAEIPGPVLRRDWRVPSASLRPLFADIDRGLLSTRGIDRVLKVAWTLADLAGHDRPTDDDIDGARSLRYGKPHSSLARSA